MMTHWLTGKPSTAAGRVSKRSLSRSWISPAIALRCGSLVPEQMT